MGRLFWKFFSFFWLTSLASVMLVGATVWLTQLAREKTLAIDGSPPAFLVVLAAVSTLRHGGSSALRDLLAEWANRPMPPLRIVDERGMDVLGRSVPVPALEEARRLVGQIDRIDIPEAVGQVRTDDGHTWIFFVPVPPERLEMPPPPPHGPHGGPHPPPPLMLLLMSVVGGLVFAALLARYFSRPIRSLRSAFEAVAEGYLDTRIGEKMGKRRDELTDLARYFDLMASRLQILVENQQRLLHDVSHELRSPLARLRAAIDLLQQQPEHADRFIARIALESTRIDRLVGEILTLARLDSGTVGHLDEQVDLVNVLTSIIDDAQFETEAKGCVIDLKHPMSISVTGNTELLHRAFENVIRNAVRHSPSVGQIIIQVQIDPPDPRLRISVEDEGPGVPEEDLERIFEPFVRLETPNEHGHGLGLAIARRIIHAHGGNISAERCSNRGLRVTICLPVLPQPE
ncbi:Histidine kinase [Gammaproteobacteria bacterium]